MSNGGDKPQPNLFRLWVRKGSPFRAQVPHNPLIEHDGGSTVVPLALGTDQVSALLATIHSFGCEVDLIPMERQTPEQEVERMALLGIGRGDVVWPSAACPECSWFDPLLADTPCGRAGWIAEAISALMETPKPRQDADACPVPHLWTP